MSKLVPLLLSLWSSLALSAGVASFSPQGENPRPEQLRITFSTPMTALAAGATAPAPIRWDCPLNGAGRWVDDKNWVFSLSATPQANTTCAISLMPGLKDLKGDVLPAARFAFRTGAPSIVRSWPFDSSQVDEDQVFALQFNTVLASTPKVYCQSSAWPEQLLMQPIAAEARRRLLAHLANDEGLAPKDADRVATLSCPRRLPADSALLLRLARDDQQVQRINYSVRAPFTATVRCQRENARAQCNPLTAISLVFSEPILRAQAAAIRLGGKAAGLGQQEREVTELVFAPPFTPRQTLGLSLPANVRDVSGRLLSNLAELQSGVRIADYSPLAKFSAAPFGVLEAADPVLPLTLRGVEGNLSGVTPQLRGKTLWLNDDRAMMRWLGKFEQYHESSIPPSRQLEGAQPVESRRLSLLNSQRQASELKLPSTPDKQGHWPFEVIGLPLPKRGLHLVELESRVLGQALLGEPQPMYVRTAALVTNLAVHLKITPENAAVWVSTLNRARPVAKASVRVYDCTQALLWQGDTDAQGVARIPHALKEPQCDKPGELSGLFVVARARDAQGTEDMAFARSGWNQGLEAWRFPFSAPEDGAPPLVAHSILDRSLLRPGETVSMKHILRTRDARGLHVFEHDALPDEVRISHKQSEQTYTLPLTWRQRRYAETRFTLPVNAALGEYSITLVRKGRRVSGAEQAANPRDDGYQLESSAFRVEEFVLPALFGQIHAAPGAGVAARELPLSVQVNWANGGPARDWPLTVSAMLHPRESGVAGYETYSFEPMEDTGAQALNGKLVLDKAALKLDAQGNGRLLISRLPALDRPYWLKTEASLSDPSGERQTVSRWIALWPAATRVGVTASPAGKDGARWRVDALTLDLAGKPQAGRKLRVRMVGHDTLSARKRVVGGFYAWEHAQTRRDEGEVCQGVSDSQGRFDCQVTVKPHEQVEFIAEAEDDRGQRARASYSVWPASGEDAWFDAADHDRIDIIPDKTEYQPGERARFQVRMPFRRATAWVAIERGGVLDTRVIELDRPEFELDIAPDWTPNVYVSVLAVRGRLREVPWYSFFAWGWRRPKDWWDAFWHERPDYTPASALVDLSRPAVKYGIAQIRVGDRAHRLSVTVTPERERYGVRQTARARVQVRLPDGRPAPAGSEVAFAAVDEALLELQPNASWNLLREMFPDYGYRGEIATSQQQVVGKRHYGRKALPPGGGGGKAPTRQLLDTLLTWQPAVKLDARGEAMVDIPVNDVLSRFRLVAVADVGEQLFGAGEASFEVAQDVQLVSGLSPLTREGDAMTAAVTVRNGSKRPLTLTVSASRDSQTLPAQRLTLAAGDARQLSWAVTTPAGVSVQQWLFAARAEDGSASDRLSLRQRVEPAVPVSVWQGAFIRLEGEQSLPVALPAGALPGQGGVRVSVQSRLAGELPGVARWLEDYPFSCLEQRAAVALGRRDAAAWAKLQEDLPGYLDEHGLADYFPRSSANGPSGSDVLTSHLLSVSHEAGQPLPDALRERMLAGLSAFVEGRIKRELPGGAAGLDARRLAAMLALQRHGRFRPAMLDVLSVQPQTWPTPMLVNWAELLLRQPAIPARDARLAQASQLLRARLLYQGARLALAREQQDSAWWLMEDGDLASARLLWLASQLPDWRDDAPRLAVGLLARQQGGHWRTTTANLWGVLATRAFSAQFERVPVRGQTTAALGEARATVTPAEAPVSAPLLPWPASGQGTLRLSHQGSGAPWASVLALAAVKFDGQRSAGYSVQKTLTPLSQRTPGQYSPGDVLKVTLDIRAEAGMGWVALNDPIPAGASLLGSGLGRDSQIAVSQAGNDDSVTPSFVERRHSGYLAYFRQLPAGVHRLSYTLRLNQAGVFQLPPTRIEAMYAPEQYGMLANAPLTVTHAR